MITIGEFIEAIKKLFEIIKEFIDSIKKDDDETE